MSTASDSIESELVEELVSLLLISYPAVKGTRYRKRKERNRALKTLCACIHAYLGLLVLTRCDKVSSVLAWID